MSWTVTWSYPLSRPSDESAFLRSSLVRRTRRSGRLSDTKPPSGHVGGSVLNRIDPTICRLTAPDRARESKHLVQKERIVLNRALCSGESQERGREDATCPGHHRFMG